MKFRFGSAFLAGFLFAGGQALSGMAGMTAGAMAEEISLVDDLDQEPVKAVLCPSGQDFGWIAVSLAVGDMPSCLTDLSDLQHVPETLNHAELGQGGDQPTEPFAMTSSNDFDPVSSLGNPASLGDRVVSMR